MHKISALITLLSCISRISGPLTKSKATQSIRTAASRCHPTTSRCPQTLPYHSRALFEPDGCRSSVPFARAHPAVWLQHHPAPTPRTAPLHERLEERNIPNPAGTERCRGQHPPGTAVRGRSVSRLMSSLLSPPPRDAPGCRWALNGCWALSRQALPAGLRGSTGHSYSHRSLSPCPPWSCRPPAGSSPPVRPVLY